jgi:co-chaperonin GroES (HSP10)
VRQEAAPETKGLIAIPEEYQDKERPLVGVVEDIGEGMYDEAYGIAAAIALAVDTVMEMLGHHSNLYHNTPARRPMSVKVGDRVLFGKYAGTRDPLVGKDRIILREVDLFGVMTDEDDDA